MRTISDGVMLTNGLGFSPDGKLLYHSDARAPLVRVYDVKADGSVGPWRKFASLGEDRVPDGLKVASDGSVWVADAHGGRVAVFNPDGSHRKDIAVPLPMVTSLCFGGDDLRDLYIVTGSRGGPRENCGTHLRDEGRRRGPRPAAGQGQALGELLRRHLHQVADLGQALVDLLGLLAAEIEHQPVDAELGVALHRIGAIDIGGVMMIWKSLPRFLPALAKAASSLASMPLVRAGSQLKPYQPAPNSAARRNAASA